jgi:predicted phage replisome organizer
MAEVKWVKLTTDMFDNRKIKHLRRLPEGNNIVLIWVMLLTMAGRCNAGGMIFLTENIPYTAKMLADELDFEENTVLLALQVLEQLDMIVTDNGFFSIAGWEEYQNADKLAEIRAKDRERKRLKRAQAKALPQVSTDVHGMSTECPHIEEEKEEEKEKEFHSFVHSVASEGKNDLDSYVQQQVDESGLEGSEADAYKQGIVDRLKLKYMGGSLGQGIVLMSEEQFGNLCEILSLDEIEKYFSIIVECEKNGKHYKKKSHYQAILDMVNKDRKVGKVMS